MNRKILAILLIFSLIFTSCGLFDSQSEEDQEKPINKIENEENFQEDDEVELPDEDDETEDLDELNEDQDDETEDPDELDEDQDDETEDPDELDENQNDDEEEKPAPDNSGKKLVAFTFDDGPSKYTPAILDAFKEVGGHGTFFLVGNRVKEFSSLVKREVDEGHEIGNHSYSHADLTKLSPEKLNDELEKSNDVIKNVANYSPKIARPTYGARNDSVRSAYKTHQMAGILWNLDTRDWDHKNRDKLYNVLMNDVKPGDIVLMHDLYESTKNGVIRAMRDLSAQGYEFVTVSDLMAAYGINLIDGEMYYKRK